MKGLCAVEFNTPTPRNCNAFPNRGYSLRYTRQRNSFFCNFRPGQRPSFSRRSFPQEETYSENFPNQEIRDKMILATTMGELP